jgi:hypothetical protein
VSRWQPADVTNITAKIRMLRQLIGYMPDFKDASVDHAAGVKFSIANAFSTAAAVERFVR